MQQQRIFRLSFIEGKRKERQMLSLICWQVWFRLQTARPAKKPRGRGRREAVNSEQPWRGLALAPPEQPWGGLLPHGLC